MRYVTFLALVCLYASADNFNTIYQEICPKGEHHVVTVSGEWVKNSKTGKTTFVAGEGRPVSQCVKDGIKKDTKPKKKKSRKLLKKRALTPYKYSNTAVPAVWDKPMHLNRSVKPKGHIFLRQTRGLTIPIPA